MKVVILAALLVLAYSFGFAQETMLGFSYDDDLSTAEEILLGKGYERGKSTDSVVEFNLAGDPGFAIELILVPETQKLTGLYYYIPYKDELEVLNYAMMMNEKHGEYTEVDEERGIMYWVFDTNRSALTLFNQDTRYLVVLYYDKRYEELFEF
ncbi:MAG: hypothetical protein PHI68_04205 [Candidatus Cloacimonetes bacterium]|nr:hypothetical protein [Candidatus Cloacimonadota bacterium]